MSDLTPKQQQLMNAWGAVYKGAGEALDWIERVRGNAASVEAEADDLSLRLRKARNQARSLQHAASTPMGVGFFGLSQAGKSYLISALAANSAGVLESDFGGRTLNFLKDVNPTGSGAEATGVVTRFSRRSQPAPDANYPIELKMLREIELAKILGNTWFEDFNHDKTNYQITPQRIDALLREFEGQEAELPQPGVDGDDVVSLWEYLSGNFTRPLALLDDLYWPRVIKLAPRLSTRQRARLLSPLWGEQALLTELYETLAGALQKLGHPEKVYAPLTAFLQDTEDARYNIMAVTILNRLGTRRDVPINVLPSTEGKVQSAVGITVAQLAALTVEMTFRLVNPPNDEVVNQVDLLDFPGYRSRYAFSNIREAANGQNPDEVSPVWNLLVRGKVAYLFERYSDAQEMNALVICTSTKGQSEVVSVAPVLSKWIGKTQGHTPKERAARVPGLIWAITMMDVWIDESLKKANRPQRIESCENLMKMTIVERFGTEDWVLDWSGQPFNNTYLVRKPRHSRAFIDFDDKGDEVRVSEHYGESLELLTAEFKVYKDIVCHVKEPEAAFAAVMGMNDGGISRFASSFTPFADIGFKLSRIEEQLHKCRTGLLEEGLYAWREEDFEALLARKMQKIKFLLRPLGADPDVISEVILALQLPTEQLRELYLSGVYNVDDDEDEAGETEPAFTAPANKAPAIDFDFDDAPAPASAPVSAPVAKPLASRLNAEQRFARAALKAWIKHMRELGNQPQRLVSLRMTRELMDGLVEELVSAARRPALLEQLDAAVTRRIIGGARRDQLVQRQVLEVQLVMRDFLSWFGLLGRPLEQRPPRMQGNKGPVFDFYSKVAVGDLPDLPESPSHQEQRFHMDWLSSLAWMIKENAKSGSDPEITTEQRRQLAVLLSTFEAS